MKLNNYIRLFKMKVTLKTNKVLVTINVILNIMFNLIKKIRLL